MEELNLDQFLADVSSEEVGAEELVLSETAISW